MQDFESSRPGSIPGRGKCDLDFFSFPITFGGQCGGGSLMGKANAGLSLGACTTFVLDECIQMSHYRKEGCSSLGI